MDPRLEWPGEVIRPSGSWRVQAGLATSCMQQGSSEEDLTLVIRQGLLGSQTD
jgi:hypothetical protein